MKITAVVIAAAVALAVVIVTGPAAEARPQFARQQDKPCGFCHVSALGGGPLNDNGKAFRRTIVTTGQRLLYFALYFLHMPFGVAWVGLFFISFTTALRRRVLLIPPRQYLRIMLWSILVIAVSGPYVAYIRYRLTPGFFGTRMGMLLMVKVAAVLALVVSTTVLFWHCTVHLSRLYRKLEKEMDSGAPLELTPAQLALFNGQGRRRALVAVDGKLYDVTGRNLWTRGLHPGGHAAGFDLSDAFTDAPHGKEVFQRVPSAGFLMEDPTWGKGGVKWALILGSAACLAILLVISTWRWV